MKKLGQAGFTITELMISIGIAGVLASSLLIVSLGFFGQTVRSQATSEMTVRSHFALRAISEDLRLASQISATNTIPDVNAPPGGWVTSDVNNVLIIATPAVDANGQVIYDEIIGNPYLNELVYFVRNSVLYKRSLKNLVAPGNQLVTTCPAAAATAACPPDIRYTAYVNDLGLRFYSLEDLYGLDDFYDLDNIITTDPWLARSVRASLDMSRQVFGQDVTFSGSTLVKMRNHYY
jgi:prepilin-type N-terminal cleavage/methylation domain-containing protein